MRRHLRLFVFWLTIMCSLGVAQQNAFATEKKPEFLVGSGKISHKKAHREKDRWWAIDKYRHVIGSAFLMGLSYNIARVEGDVPREKALRLAIGISFSAGIGKELRDKWSGRGHASWKDLVADLAGIGIGWLLFSNKND